MLIIRLEERRKRCVRRSGGIWNRSLPGSRKMTETANGKVTANEQITANGKVTANEKIAVKMPGIKRGTRKNQNWHGRRQKKRSGESLLRGGMIMTILLPTGVGTIISGPESVKATALFR